MLNSAGIKGLQWDVRDLKFMKNVEDIVYMIYANSQRYN